MQRSGEMLVDNRVVLQFRTRLEVCTNGRHRLMLETLNGVLVGEFDGKDSADVEHQLIAAGYQRIPPAMADDLDIWRLGLQEEHRLPRRPDVR